MKEITFTRKELHEYVWNESLNSIAKKYDSTYYELRKLCSEMNIPLPKAGYWENLRLGRKVSKEKLPDNHNGKQETILQLLEVGDERKIRTKKVIDEQTKVFQNFTQESIMVSKRLSNPDPLILAAKEKLEKASSNYSHYKGLVFSSNGNLDITVTPVNIPRALRFMDTLIKQLRSKGHDIIFKNYETYALIDGQEVQMTLREKCRRFEVVDNSKWKHYDHEPTGILAFKIKVFFKETEWKDGTILIESRLSPIIALMETKAKKYKEAKLVWAKEREKEAEERRKLRAIEEQLQMEKEAFQSLINDARKWHELNILQDYLAAIEENAISNSALTDELQNKLWWAREKIHENDPIKLNKSVLNLNIVAQAQ